MELAREVGWFYQEVGMPSCMYIMTISLVSCWLMAKRVDIESFLKTLTCT